ncbi:natural resistance-associated macrophage protein-domain-containing protein [Chlamydoabsidia padenii]|nr:natural resistance-associated macrophage protein-domain-containing protein [Chlamydoabsidia padenii]
MGINSLTRLVSYLRKLALFIGPGFMIAVGYLDPGNWATNIQAGSQFGYRLLFIILVSNLIALFLQNLTIRLGTVTGLDLAAACRHYLPRYVSLFLYVLAEIAIVATDLAEVIGSAIALNLLFPTLPLPAGVAITATDVFIILLCYKEPNDDDDDDDQDDTARMVRYFEMFVMVLVAAVGICFIIEMAYSDIVAVDVLKGYLPTSDIFTDTESLYVSIGIIGATVMPHNLFLHSFIVQARCNTWRHARPTLVSDDTNEPVNIRYNPRLLDTIQEKEDASSSDQQQWDEDKKTTSLPSSIITQELHVVQQQRQLDMDQLRHYLTKHMRRNLHYGFIDLMIALLFAFFVNSAILVVASANFHFGGHIHTVSDLFDAHALLQQFLGPAAAVIFALALLFAGQSSTLTATLAGQVVMSGFLGMTSRPWLRRILTRLVAIVPAMVAACVAGRAGLSQMLVGSQVALSIQLPFAVVPLVLFTTWPRVMHLDLVNNNKKNKLPSALPGWLDRLCFRLGHTLDQLAQRVTRSNKNNNKEQNTAFDDNVAVVVKEDERKPTLTTLSSWPDPIYYANGKCVAVVAVLISLLLIGLNGYLVVASILGY